MYNKQGTAKRPVTYHGPSPSLDFTWAAPLFYYTQTYYNCVLATLILSNILDYTGGGPSARIKRPGREDDKILI
jgi:hypothetical protein